MTGLRRGVVVLALVITGTAAVAMTQAPRLDGFNLIRVPGHPFGGADAGRSVMQAKRLGAGAIAVVPFLWQATPASTAEDVLRCAWTGACARAMAR